MSDQNIIEIFIDVTKPARSSLVSDATAAQAARAKIDYVLRDTPIQRIHLIDGTNGPIALGVDDVLSFGAKPFAKVATALEPFCFFSDAFASNGSDAYEADLNLNTTEFADAFSGSNLALMVEVELYNTTTGIRRTLAQFKASGIFDVIRGDEGVPTSGDPEYLTVTAAESQYTTTARATANESAISRRTSEPTLYFDGSTAASKASWTLGTHGAIGSGKFSVGLSLPVPTSLPTANRGVLAISGSSSGAFIAYGMGIYLTSTGTLNVRLYGSTTSMSRTRTYSGFQSAYAGRTVDFVFVRDGSDIFIYVDGVLLTGSTESTAGGTPPAWSEIAASGYLIAGVFTSNDLWQGPLGAPRPINRVVTAAEVLERMANGYTYADTAGGSMVPLTSGLMTVGRRYRITTQTTSDFTTVGAADSVVGTEFIATGTGSGLLDASNTVIPLGLIFNPEITPGRFALDKGPNRILGTLTAGVTPIVPSPKSQYTIEATLAHDGISATSGTTTPFSLPPNTVIETVDYEITTAFDAAITLNVGTSGTPAKFASALAADATGIGNADSLAKAIQSRTEHTPIYIQKSGATTQGSITIFITISLRGYAIA